MNKLLIASLLTLSVGTAFAADITKTTDTVPSTEAKAIEKTANSPQMMSMTRLKLGGKEITVLIAETKEQREEGLMHVEKMDENNGMIFSYGAPVEKACMWMKNTKIPRDVAFIDGNGKIVNIEEMKPLTTDNHCNTSGPIFYALEMNAGWFAKNGVKAGDSISN